MENKFLLPNRFKLIGWVILALSIILGIADWIFNWKFPFLYTKVFAIIGNEILGTTKYFSWVHADLTFTIIGSLFIIGALLIAFSKEKQEDEFIMKLRLLSFQWAVLVNYIILFLSFLFVFGPDFFSVMLFNMFTVIVLFIVRFHYLLIKNRN